MTGGSHLDDLQKNGNADAADRLNLREVNGWQTPMQLASHQMSMLLPLSMLNRPICALQTCSSVFSALSAAVGAADKVIELIHRQPRIQPSGALIPANFEGRLQLDNVCFSYPGRKDVQVLNGLSMTIQPGEASQQSHGMVWPAA